MSTRLINIVVDAAEPGALARFWAGLLDRPVTVDRPGEADVTLIDGGPSPLDLTFVPVPERKTAPNRLHLDVASESAGHHRELVARAVAAGGTTIDIGQHGVPWEVLADPEGNELCVREPGACPGSTGAIAAICFDARDPAALGEFWARATGWSIERRRADLAGLRAPGGHGPWLEFWHTAEPKVGKNRWHLDVAPQPGGDIAAEADRLVGLGARRIDIGQGGVPWQVLADPEGNECCVLGPR